MVLLPNLINNLMPSHSFALLLRLFLLELLRAVLALRPSGYRRKAPMFKIASGDLVRKNLASHFARSSSNHSYGYAFSDDHTNCLARFPLKYESFMKYPGREPMINSCPHILHPEILITALKILRIAGYSLRSSPCSRNFRPQPEARRINYSFPLIIAFKRNRAESSGAGKQELKRS